MESSNYRSRAMQLIKSAVFNNGNHSHPSFVPNLDNNDQQNFYEKDLKVDKKILEVMKLGGNESHPPLSQFLSKISLETNVQVEVSTSMRDRQGNEIPVLKLKAINQKQLEVASALIMERLDPHRDKMTFNIDVPYSDHSYIIGKDGTRIKQLSRMTGCHIHLPDCNKTSNKKSNKLSIAGTDFCAIDKARDQIRKSLPLNIGFKAQIKSEKFVIIDTASAEVQAVKRKYRVDVTFTNVLANTKYPEVTINVKGGRSQLEDIEAATHELYHFVTEEKLINNPNVVFTITIDVSHSHHQYVKGKNNCNLKVINQRSGAMITFPSHDSSSNQVIIQSKNLLSTVMGWQELMGYLPLLLSFDVNFDINAFHSNLQRMEKEFGVGIRTREKLSGHVYTILVKTQERHSTYLQEIRQKILAMNQSNVQHEQKVKPPLANILANATNNNNQQNNFNEASTSSTPTSYLNLAAGYQNFTANILQPLLKASKTATPMMASNLNIGDDTASSISQFDQENCKLCRTNRIPLADFFRSNNSSIINEASSNVNSTSGTTGLSLPFLQASSTYDPFKFRMENFDFSSNASTLTEVNSKIGNGDKCMSGGPQQSGLTMKWSNNSNSPGCLSNESGFYGYSPFQSNGSCFKYSFEPNESQQSQPQQQPSLKNYASVFKY